MNRNGYGMKFQVSIYSSNPSFQSFLLTKFKKQNKIKIKDSDS